MDKIQKFLLKLSKKERAVLTKVFLDIRSMQIATYDVKPLEGHKGIFRLRKGKMRIIFAKTAAHGVAIDIAYRKDIYKSL